MSTTSPGRQGRTPFQSPILPPTHDATTLYSDSTSSTNDARRLPTPQHRGQRSSPSSRIPNPHPYNTPPRAPNVQNFTPTRPSPLSQILFPPADPNFDMTPNFNVNVSPSMNIDPTLLNWPDDNQDWPNSEDLDAIFGPASPFPTNSQVEGCVDIAGGGSTQQLRDFTLIPPPLSLTPSRRITTPMMFGNLMPAPLSPSRRTPPAIGPQLTNMEPARPSPSTPSQPSLDCQIAPGDNNAPPFTFNTLASPGHNNLRRQHAIERKYLTERLTDATNPNTEQSLNRLRYITPTTVPTPRSVVPSPSRHQLSTLEAIPTPPSFQSSPSTSTPSPQRRTKLTCNLCLLPFYPSDQTLRPDANGRAYCAQCIKTVGDRIVEEQKIKMGIGRSGARALARERTRVGGGDKDQKDDASHVDSTSGVVGNVNEEISGNSEFDEIWNSFLGAEGAVTGGLPAIDGGAVDAAEACGVLNTPRGVDRSSHDGHCEGVPSGDGSGRAHAAHKSGSTRDGAGMDGSGSSHRPTDAMSEEWVQRNAQQIRELRYYIGFMGSPRTRRRT